MGWDGMGLNGWVYCLYYESRVMVWLNCAFFVCMYEVMMRLAFRIITLCTFLVEISYAIIQRTALRRSNVLLQQSK